MTTKDLITCPDCSQDAGGIPVLCPAHSGVSREALIQEHDDLVNQYNDLPNTVPVDEADRLLDKIAMLEVHLLTTQPVADV